MCSRTLFIYCYLQTGRRKHSLVASNKSHLHWELPMPYSVIIFTRPGSALLRFIYKKPPREFFHTSLIETWGVDGRRGNSDGYSRWNAEILYRGLDAILQISCTRKKKTLVNITQVHLTTRWCLFVYSHSWSTSCAQLEGIDRLQWQRVKQQQLFTLKSLNFINVLQTIWLLKMWKVYVLSNNDSSKVL